MENAETENAITILDANDASFLVKSAFLPPQEGKGKESIVNSLVRNITSK
jgi:hypothetical protein